MVTGKIEPCILPNKVVVMFEFVGKLKQISATI